MWSKQGHLRFLSYFSFVSLINTLAQKWRTMDTKLKADQTHSTLEKMKTCESKFVLHYI